MNGGKLTKDEIKNLIDADPKLMWWAAVLFAEISVLVNSDQNNTVPFPKEFCSIIKAKVNEFPLLVIQRAHEKAVEQLTNENEEKS